MIKMFMKINPQYKHTDIMKMTMPEIVALTKEPKKLEHEYQLATLKGKALKYAKHFMSIGKEWS